MGRLGNSLCIPVGGKFDASPRRSPKCGEVSYLSPGFAGGVHAGAAAAGPGSNCSRSGIVGNDGARSGGLVSRGSPDGVLRPERGRTAPLEGGRATKLLLLFCSAGRS